MKCTYCENDTKNRYYMPGGLEPVPTCSDCMDKALALLTAIIDLGINQIHEFANTADVPRMNREVEGMTVRTALELCWANSNKIKVSDAALAAMLPTPKRTQC